MGYIAETAGRPADHARVLDRLRPKTLRAKLLALLITPALVVIAAMVLVAATRSASAQRSSAYEQAQQLAQTHANAFDAEAQRHREITTSLAAEVRAFRGGDRANLTAMSGAVIAANPDLQGLYINLEPNSGLGPDSQFINAWRSGNSVNGRVAIYWQRVHNKLEYATPSGTTDPKGNENWYGGPRDAGHFVALEPYTDPNNHVLMTSYVTPMFKGSRFIGVVGLDVALTSLQQQMQKVHVLKSGYAFVVSNHGELLTSPNPKLIGKSSLGKLAKSTDQPALAQLASLVRHGGSGHVTATDPFTGKQVTMFAAPVATGNWSVITVAPNSEMMASANHLRTLLIVIGLVALAILGVVITLVATRVSKPIQALAASADLIAEGDLDVTVEHRSEDEVGTMAEAFRRMVGYLQRTADTAEHISEGDLTGTVTPVSDRDRLGVSFARMQDALRGVIGEIGAQSQTLAVQSEEMAANADETGRAVEEIARALGEVASGSERQVESVARTRESADLAAEQAEQARKLATRGEVASRSAAEAMAQVQSSSDAVATVMSQLTGTSERIGGITDQISQIADQTTLLALNAAIEAARAGEQGRGFAVVAEEVRKLSEETSSAAGSISELIGAIQSEASDAEAATARSAEHSRTAADTVADAREVFEQIAGAVGEMHGRVDRIAASSGEVVSVAESAAAAAEQVSASTEQTSSSAQEITAGAHEVAQSSERLSQAVAWFRV